MEPENIRKLFIVAGRVQGVGFRPFIWKLATACGLVGSICNTSAGVRIEVQGGKAMLDEFERHMREELPPLALVTSISGGILPPKSGETSFVILHSTSQGSGTVLVGPDVAICDDCLADIRDPGNSRFGYAFANCTNCGPRYSITGRIPYDRACTSMSCFEMCDSCAAEYTDPGNRRFHAQPIACEKCGPGLWLVEREDLFSANTRKKNDSEAIARLCKALLAGKIAALRGLGGFQLACDARNETAVAELRRRKHRPHKALAVMVADVAGARQFCQVNSREEAWLEGRQKPIVLCRNRADPVSPLSGLIAPDTDSTGIMLPYTPMHALLLDWLANNGMSNPAIVLTSANPSGEPICLGNREALERLADLADVWLLHDRDILCRVDDSVLSLQGGKEIFLRRARGFVPEPVPLAGTGPVVLGTGAQLKATFCLTRADQAFLSQHIGDLDSPACMDFYEETLGHMQRLLEVEPEAIVHDLHPDFMTTSFASAMAQQKGIPQIALQHHVAHAMACLAENGIYEPALALCLDGSGLGDDGVVWGGELLLVDPGAPAWQRLGGLEPFRLPGGEAAIREPWRIASGMGHKCGNPAERAVLEMLKANINCPVTTSAGRLFDAVSAKLGLCGAISYEGQAAMRLEKCASQWLASNPMPDISLPALIRRGGLWMLDSQAIFDLCDPERPEYSAALFHFCLARGFVELARQAAAEHGIARVALSGGVMQNRIMSGLLSDLLVAAGLEPVQHRLLPPGDGCISYGQAVWGRQALAKA